LARQPSAICLGGRADIATPELRRRMEDDRWFKEEVEPHARGLRAWLRVGFSALRDIDDVVQESYLRLMRARAKGPIACPRTYLYGIARHVAIESCRMSRVFANLSVNELPESHTIEPAADVVQIVSHNQELALVIEAVKTLPERCRQIVMLRTQEGLTYQEIATRLGVAEETVRVQMARAVHRCAKMFRQYNACGETVE
jgi:RNA polymerase sigma factor (sigma-70 family)